MPGENREKRGDLVLPPGTYAYFQDQTKGMVKVYTGPTAVTPSAQEVPVIWNVRKHCFERVELEQALCMSPVAVEGWYMMLLNPAKGGLHPSEGSAQASADLEVGRKVIVPGPAMFALWPCQVAEVIRGHHLHSNQYLLCRVYNEEEARKNWTKAVVKPAGAPGDKGESTESKSKATLAPPPDLTVGKMLIIKGTEVSFYIPPTGITVVQEGMDAQGKPSYVREALTLERLEYAILIDENGKKRYERGPTVVFPEPTERFMEARDDEGRPSRKFRAIELNEIQGIHLKVIADYEENGTKHKAGEEIFLTGKDTSIYYPREEHSAIKYDGKVKHFATAIPVGEARYVLNRNTGEIKTVKGPAMLLPDPRSEVIVRRVLSDKECQLWYPGNEEALEYNRGLREILAKVPTTRGAPSEGDIERNYKAATAKGSRERALMAAPVAAAAANMVIADSSRVSKEQGYVGEEFVRGSTYTQPRTVTLDTKYQGVPPIEVWTGYAVMVVDKSGKRRVEKAPATILLNYDEGLEALTLSTGKPKTTDNLYRTAYLRVENNQVTDYVRVETADHVQITLKLSYRVNFEGEPTKWWNVENYVKTLCDHARSVLKGQIRKTKVEEFYANSTDMLRDMILGPMTDVATTGSKAKMGRSGMFFPENGMRVTDVEVLGVEISDERIRQMLDGAQLDVVKTNIELSNAKRALDVVKVREQLTREEAETRAETVKKKAELDTELAAVALAVSLAKLGNALKEAGERKQLVASQEEEHNFTFNSEQDRKKKAAEQQLALSQKQQDQEIQKLKAEVEAVVERFKVAQGGFSEALLALSNNETMQKIAQAWSIQRVIGGESVSDALRNVFINTPLAPLMEKMTKVPPGNGRPEAKPLPLP